VERERCRPPARGVARGRGRPGSHARSQRCYARRSRDGAIPGPPGGARDPDRELSRLRAKLDRRGASVHGRRRHRGALVSGTGVQAGAVPSTEFGFTSADGLRIACARWESRGPVRGVVQIAHGMGEHLGRYAGTVTALASAGLTVYGNDHRGHGHTAPSPADLGDFGEGGFDLLVEDMARLSRIAREEFPGRPLILLGHSMGSFAAQQYVLEHSHEIDGLVLSGSGALDALAQAAGAAAPGENVLNARFEPARTPFDWLSRDRAVVDA